jgi:hypothetical protein
MQNTRLPGSAPGWVRRVLAGVVIGWSGGAIIGVIGVVVYLVMIWLFKMDENFRWGLSGFVICPGLLIGGAIVAGIAAAFGIEPSGVIRGTLFGVLILGGVWALYLLGSDERMAPEMNWVCPITIVVAGGGGGAAMGKWIWQK